MRARQAGRELDAINHRHPRLRQRRHACGIQNGRDACQLLGRALAAGQVVHRQQRMGLATTKGRLQLNHGVAAPARQPLGHTLQQQAHALGDEGAGKKLLGVLVLRLRRACMHLRDVSREFALLEGAFQHVLVGVGDFAPGLDCHEVRISNGNRIPRQHVVVLSQATNGTNRCRVHLLDRSTQLETRIGGLYHLRKQPVGPR